jgi:SagB-type dehydrogenase family enzyme
MMTCIALALGEGVRLELEGEEARLQGPLGGLAIRRPTPRLREALQALAAGATEDALVALAGPDAVLLFFHLESAAGLGLLRWTVLHQGQRLATLSPTSASFVRHPAGLEPERRYRLSRFAYCRGMEHGVVVECPLSFAHVELHDGRAAALFYELARGGNPRELEERIAPGLDPGAARAVIQLFTEAGMLAAESLEEPPSPSAVALRQWEFHDLLFHARSRGTRYGSRSGATYRFEGQIPSLPAVKPPMSEVTLELFRPDLAALQASDPPFSEVLERRRTLYSRGPTPLTAQQLGEFLFRCARVRQVRPSPAGEVSDRPYPGAGARYELELYPLVHACEGIPAGLYHYCPLQHRLERLSDETQEVLAVLEAGRSSPPLSGLPDVLFVIAARFPRVTWKYESIAYSLILKDVGVLFQTMYLVATAMSLSPYALGRGDSDLFCRAAGTDYSEETSVGEFALSGSPA